MHDTLYHGKRFRTLNVIDEGVREALAIEVDTSLPAERVIRVLEQLKESRPLPRQIRVDNGPELISAKLIAWCDNHQIRLRGGSFFDLQSHLLRVPWRLGGESF